MEIKDQKTLIGAIESLIRIAEYNGETRSILDNIYAMRMRLPNPLEIEKVIRVKTAPKTYTGTSGEPIKGKMLNLTLVDYEQKKTDQVQSQDIHNPVTHADNPNMPVQEKKEETNHTQVIDIFTRGQDDAKKKYKNPKNFIQELLKLGYNITGKTFEEAWGDLENQINGIMND